MSNTIESRGAVRTFLAVPVSPEVNEALKELQHRLRVALSGVSWSSPEQQHLTIRFYGDVRVEGLPLLQEAMQQICAQAPPFRLCAERVGAFDGRIIWVGVSGGLQSLRELEAKIAAATRGFGNHEELRDFRPHLTIGRVKRQGLRREDMAKLQDWSNAKFGEWSVDHLELMRSTLSPQGPCHACLARIALAGKVATHD